MKLTHFIIVMISLPKYLFECFYIPQPYSIKMYHHASLVMTGEDDIQESYILNLTASRGQSQRMHGSSKLQNSKGYNARKKRTVSDTSIKPLDNQYDADESLYEGTFEESEGVNKSQTNSSVYDYDYEKFKKEYYQEETTSQNKTQSNESLYEEYSEQTTETTVINLNKTRTTSVSTENVPMENYCSAILFFRFRMFECFLYGIEKKNDEVKQRSSMAITFWVILYVITASYLWCTRGWCCCCCPCACCHPHSVIHDAKEFLALNPPGVAHLHSKRKILYESSAYERECFKKLENEVYNL